MIRKAKAVWCGTGCGGAVAISQATTFALMNCTEIYYWEFQGLRTNVHRGDPGIKGDARPSSQSEWPARK